ncbi:MULTISPECIES: hypothetical protein [Vibrio]|uniref:hypothetical protein n=1 Tax=Vibrio TaxID=662 RepID=UPI000C85EE42|nr:MULTISPECIES: hypothetical protein [unclassified Vibrio]PMI21317.1 hypothetical protein BCU50_01655 [Vibrio sp. 10N.286.46.E10]PMI95183.1 hypothetical protein BCU34_19560 [Vibrio sp. 10N.286.45.E10]PTQ19192.1 hypothetical protein CWO24_23330 [Vibrio sp. 10N.286.46.E10]TKE80502.1 hypothetical protein FCV54_14295 [Vibrio sp. F12]TKE92152.1 hypothetical protein FCV53_08840 [Vibrio sp. F12]
MKKSRDNIESNEGIASIEVFGGVFAILMVLFLIINLLSSARLEERLDRLSDEGDFKIKWGENGNGFVIITYPDSLFIIETGEFEKYDDICGSNSKFIDYTRKIYSQKNSQIIFSILENSVGTMRKARDCIQKTYKGKRVSIGWMIVDGNTMKAINLGDIPYYIDKNNGQKK